MKIAIPSKELRQYSCSDTFVFGLRGTKSLEILNIRHIFHSTTPYLHTGPTQPPLIPTFWLGAATLQPPYGYLTTTLQPLIATLQPPYNHFQTTL